ncbi:MAG TPA: EamA family transporter, partial [Gemmatimonadaceae bacterium]
MDQNAGDVHAPGPSADQPRPGVWLTDVTLLLMALIWGVNFVVVKFATGLVPALAFNTMRVGLAAVALMTLALLGRGRWPDRREALALLGLG